MKKILKYLLFVSIIIFGVLRISGGLTFYNLPSSGSEPNLKLNGYFIGTNFIKPKRLDFAYYKTVDLEFGDMIVVQRLIANPFDVLECKNGKFYVNDEDVDLGVNLRRMYKFSNSDFIKYIQNEISSDESIIQYKFTKDSIAVTLDDNFVDKLPIESKRVINLESEYMSKDIRKFNKTWTLDNFGPIIIPEGKSFFVGDNRGNSIDSRHKGFVENKNIIGTILVTF